MMTTNALSIVFLNAAVSWMFTTNTVEHWPQKQVFPVYDKKYYLLNNGVNADWIMPTAQWVIDTNADTMSIETTVTSQRLLSFEFEKRKFSETLTNEPWMHYSVDMQRVRTNDWCWRDGPITNTDGTWVMFSGKGQFSYPTNYFVPVKTNTLPLVPEPMVFYATNMIMAYPLSVTNIIWSMTNCIITNGVFRGTSLTNDIK